MQKPSIPKGMRDFAPKIMAKRNYIFNTIKSVYELYGYKQIETPTMENLSTLMGKYGEEGDKLLFKVLNSGDILKDLSTEELAEKNSLKLSNKICEKGLRYDLTVPLARYVVMHRDEITFPFRRFQIQPVWRADRPQKGRYREFYQCDADIIGSTSLINEVELLQIIDEVFNRLGVKVRILLNNRKILTGIAKYLGVADRIVDITIAIDKLDKIGQDKVNIELLSKGFDQMVVEKLQPILSLSGSNREKLNKLKSIFEDNEIGNKGIEEIEFILNYIDMVNISSELEVDLSLARGLSYYTGAIIEVKAVDVSIGSISGGGRYDNLTGIFGLEGISGVGISFGADRIYDVLEELDLFPQKANNSTQIMFVNFGEKEQKYLMPIVTNMRKNDIRAEIYPDSIKIKKQMSYANSSNIKFVAIVGEEEIKNNVISIKDMHTGKQVNISLKDAVQFIKEQG